MPVARVLDNWDVVCAMFRVDAGAGLAVKSGSISAADAGLFLTEQQDRASRGMFAASTFSARALGTNPS
jgi:hypothetical protein